MCPLLCSRIRDAAVSVIDTELAKIEMPQNGVIVRLEIQYHRDGQGRLVAKAVLLSIPD